jgi:glycosyltransferase involved in cell wall biosynthesis
MKLGLTKYHNKKPASHTLLIALDKSVKNSGLFIKIAQRLKKRFGIEVAIVVKEPEVLLFNRGLLLNLEAGLFSRVWISDQPTQHGFDFFEFSKRQETERITFARYSDLDKHWLELVKHFVNVEFAEFDSFYSDNRHFGTFSQKRVRELDSKKPMTLLVFEHELMGSRENEKDKRASLFVTKQGLERFGGYQAFRKLPLTIGGLKPSEFRRIWIIDNSYKIEQLHADTKRYTSDRKAPVTLPGFFNGKHANALADINPASVELAEGAVSSGLAVPRGCLSITKTDSFRLLTSNVTKAVFAMSNYNKAKYIPSALYSVAMQTYENVSLNITDDISSDESRGVIEAFIGLLKPEKISVNFKKNKETRGTYWIRNEIIHSNKGDRVVYFVNDSDDYSVAQRVAVQLKEVSRNKDAKIAFGDIVRVDSSYQLLPLDGKVERYGTASLASRTKTHDEFGYYENIMKNADTEFIERLRHFAGKKATKWFRYPVLFQPFDGTNLTSDIYQVQQSGEIKQSLNKREKHVELFKERHASAKVTDLAKIYGFPKFDYSPDYRKVLSDYLIPSFRD